MRARALPAAVLVTLGCAKNLVDSEHIVGLLQEAGFAVSALDAGACGNEPDLDAVEADVAVVNTCGFIDAAKAESVGVILDLARRKEAGRLRALVVAGCLAQRYAADLMREIPAVDAVVGTGEFPRIVSVVRAALAGRRLQAVDAPHYRYDRPLPRARLTAPYTAYIKIAEGCDHACAFCVIPQLRGPFRSRPLEAVVEEAAGLAAAGVREVNLVAQDASRYGWDLAGRSLLPELLERLNAVPGLRWIRVLYNYPTTFTRRLAEAMASLDKVCAYVDIPLQHGNDRILAGMRRGACRDALLRRVAELRAVLPEEAVFRSSFIVGFPGETEAEFADLLRFLEEIEFDYAGFFTYSREEGTAAAALPRQVPRRVAERRQARAMAVQRRISLRRNRRHVGRCVEVLVEGEEPGQLGYYRGRWRGQAPEVDGQVIFAAARPLEPGEIVRVRVTWAEEYDLHGEAVMEGGKMDGGKRKAP